MGKLIELAERAERASADEQRAILEEAFVAIHGPKPPRILGGSDEMTVWLDLHNPFFRMLEAEAYESAAMQLVPEDHGAMMCDPRDEQIKPWAKLFPPDQMEHLDTSSAATPALAICASSLRARDGGEGL